MKRIIDPQEASAGSPIRTRASTEPVEHGIQPQAIALELPLTEPMPQKESPMRSLAKALSWRMVALTITVSVAWSITGDTTIAATVGAADTAIKIGAYYLHERAWLQSSFGR